MYWHPRHLQEHDRSRSPRRDNQEHNDETSFMAHQGRLLDAQTPVIEHDQAVRDPHELLHGQQGAQHEEQEDGIDTSDTASTYDSEEPSHFSDFKLPWLRPESALKTGRSCMATYAQCLGCHDMAYSNCTS